MNRVIEKHADLATKQRTVFDVDEGDDFGEVSQYLEEFFGSGCVNQSEKINGNWANSILVKGGNGRYDGPRGGITVYENFEEAGAYRRAGAGERACPHAGTGYRGQHRQL